jgi:phosphopantetheinyl transferase
MLRVAVARIDGMPSADGDVPPAWLGGSERDRWAALAPSGHAAFVASRALLRRLLKDATGVDGHRWDVSAQAGAAPLVRLREFEGESGAPGRRTPTGSPRASLSHRFGWVAAATADGGTGPIGVDLECERPARSDPADRAALMLSTSELRAWDHLPAADREAALLRSWVAKEAWFKASPAGEAPWDFSRIVVDACEPGRANVRVWDATPLHVAVCCDDAAALAAATCDGLDAAGPARSSFWRVARVD